MLLFDPTGSNFKPMFLSFTSNIKERAHFVIKGRFCGRLCKQEASMFVWARQQKRPLGVQTLLRPWWKNRDRVLPWRPRLGNSCHSDVEKSRAEVVVRETEPRAEWREGGRTTEGLTTLNKCISPAEWKPENIQLSEHVLRMTSAFNKL